MGSPQRFVNQKESVSSRLNPGTNDTNAFRSKPTGTQTLLSRRAMFTRIGLAVLSAFGFAGTARANPKWDRVLMKRHNRFADAMNNWAREAMAQSPYSPDYQETMQEVFVSNRIGQKFRGFEDFLYAEQ